MLKKIMFMSLMVACVGGCTAAPVNPDQVYDCSGETQYCGGADWSGCGTAADAQDSVNEFCDEAESEGCGGCQAECDPSGQSCSARDEGGSSALPQEDAERVGSTLQVQQRQ
jgi:hypothetical protein